MLSNPLLGVALYIGTGLVQLLLFAGVVGGLTLPFAANPTTDYEGALVRAVAVVQPLVVMLWVLGVVVGAMMMKGGGKYADAIPGVLLVLVSVAGVGLVGAFDPVPAIFFYVWILAVVVVCAMGSSGPLGAVLRLAGAGTILYTLATSDLLTGATVSSGPVYIVPVAMLMAALVPLLDARGSR